MPAKRIQGFTLVELLVVIAILGTLIGLLLPAIQVVKESSRRATCQSHLNQIGLALRNYENSNHYFPPGYTASAAYIDGASDTTPGWGWAAFILPYIEEGPLFQQIQFSQPVERSPAIKTLISLYVCPSDMTPETPFSVTDGVGSSLAQAAPASYAACVGGDESGTSDPTGFGIFYRNSRTRMAAITDGTSSTILAGERAWSNANGIWAGAINNGVIMRGKQNPCPGTGKGSYPAGTLVLAHSHLNNAIADADGGLDDFSSNHPGGASFVFADGSVHFIRSVSADTPEGEYTAESLIFQGLGTRANGELIPAEWKE